MKAFNSKPISKEWRGRPDSYIRFDRYSDESGQAPTMPRTCATWPERGDANKRSINMVQLRYKHWEDKTRVLSEGLRMHSSDTLLKHATQNQLAMSAGAAWSHISFVCYNSSLLDKLYQLPSYKIRVRLWRPIGNDVPKTCTPHIKCLKMHKRHTLREHRINKHKQGLGFRG